VTLFSFDKKFTFFDGLIYFPNMPVKRKGENNLMKSKDFPLRREKVKNNAFCKFCKETSLPGWAYLNREMNKLWKMVWIVFLIAICGASIYVLVNIFKFYSFSVGLCHITGWKFTKLCMQIRTIFCNFKVLLRRSYLQKIA
jgi:hypothetical protein